jgi:hypothetical protein
MGCGGSTTNYCLQLLQRLRLLYLFARRRHRRHVFPKYAVDSTYTYSMHGIVT